MRSKLHLPDLNYLLWCPTSNWGTVERRSIEDAMLLRDMGANVYIVCPKNSYLDLHAQKHQITRLHLLSSSKPSIAKRISHILLINKWINDNQIGLVHIYGVNAIFEAAFILKKKFLIPLVFSFNEIGNQSFGRPWNRWLLSRLDAITTFSPVSAEIAREILGVPLRRISVLGLGIRELPISAAPVSDQHMTILTYVPPHWEGTDGIRTLLNSIGPLMNALNGDELRIHFLTDDQWEGRAYFDELSSFVTELDIQKYVSFETLAEFNQKSITAHLFVGLEGEEALSDVEFGFLLRGVPVVLPRTSARQEFLSANSLYGRTYKKGDSRDLKTKCLEIWQDYPVFRNALVNTHAQLIQLFGEANYSQELLELYSRLLEQRRRLGMIKNL